MREPDSGMTEEQQRNATVLLEIIENKLTDEQCDMSHWIARPVAAGPIPPPEQRGTPECGTAACLAGWAALMLVPSEDCDSTYHRVALAVPIELAAVCHPTRYGHSQQPDKVEVNIENIGYAVLGRDIGRWFGDSDGPTECDMTDRQWMIAVLRRELGLPHSTKLKSESERDYDREYYYED